MRCVAVCVSQGSKKKHIVTVPFHTGDFALDDIYPNYRVPPTHPPFRLAR